MKDPSDQDVGWGAVLKVNAKMAVGLIAVGYGWLCWQPDSPQYYGFWIIAVLCFAGGSLSILGACVEALRLILRLRRWKRYQSIGTTPRADRMAQEDELVAHGRADGRHRP